MSIVELSLKDEYMQEVCSKVWTSKSMQDYVEKSTSALIKTSAGYFISFSKPHIEKSFCFRYDEHISGSIESASRACNVQEEYFLEENLKEMKRTLKHLEEQDVYLLKNYSQSDLIMCFVTGDYKERFETEKYIEITDEDKNLIIETQKAEIEKFTKRLNTYWKKYGSSKLKTWTYSCWD